MRIDLESLGIVKVFIVFIDFSGANSHCVFCEALEEDVWRNFIWRIRETLKKEGFEE